LVSFYGDSEGEEGLISFFFMVVLPRPAITIALTISDTMSVKDGNKMNTEQKASESKACLQIFLSPINLLILVFASCLSHLKSRAALVTSAHIRLRV